MTTNIIFKDGTGAVKGSVNTHHDEQTFIRGLTINNLTPGAAFAKFGAPGDSITIERGLPAVAAPVGEERLKMICSGYYLPDEESRGKVSIFQIVDVELMVELSELFDEGKKTPYDELVLSVLGLEGDYGEIAPGAIYTTYSVEKISLDLVSVIETVSMNV